jgi:hypothetical protein
MAQLDCSTEIRGIDKDYVMRAVTVAARLAMSAGKRHYLAVSIFS